MTLLKKITVMALLGALGAGVGAGSGELLFFDDPAPEQAKPRQICLLFDTSGSMDDFVNIRVGERLQSQLEALKVAAGDFVARQDLELDAMGLAVFASDARVVTGLSRDAARLQQSVRGLTAEGSTNLGRGLDVAAATLGQDTGERWILLFSDGKPETSSTRESPEAAALSAAARARQAGIRIVAIGTGLADANLLAQVTGTPQNVIISDPSALAEAFRRSEEVIKNRQMLVSQATTSSFSSSVLRSGVWASLIAIGTALGLVAGQNRHLRRRLLSVADVIIVVLGGVVTGVLAGAAGQTLFYVLSDFPAIVTAGRVVAWTLLGLGIGYGMGFFVPNLHRKRAGVAGVAGGVIAAACFLTLVPVVGDTVGRLLGAAILGLSAGLTTVLVEVVYRKAWLVVHWSENESSTLALGPTPVLIGSSSEADILLAEQDSPVPVMAKITLADGVVRLEDGPTQSTRPLGDGEILTYGATRIQLRASGDAAEGTREREETTARAEEDRAVSDDSDSVERPAAQGAKWYEDEVSSS